MSKSNYFPGDDTERYRTMDKLKATIEYTYDHETGRVHLRKELWRDDELCEWTEADFGYNDEFIYKPEITMNDLALAVLREIRALTIIQPNRIQP